MPTHPRPNLKRVVCSQNPITLGATAILVPTQPESEDSTMGADVYDPDAMDDPPVPERYTAIETDDGDLVVFDAEDEDAWIQTDDATCLTELR